MANLTQSEKNNDDNLQIPKNLKQLLEKQHYAVFGHSGVQICMWTKKSLKNQGKCYKEQFYGIRCHLCCQMTPAIAWCDHSCIFCWRATEHTQGINMDKVKLQEPTEIIKGCVDSQQKLLSGFGGNDLVDIKKYKEAQEPMHFAISLSGEPTLYPKLPGLIKELRNQNKTSFLVTNGQHPEMLETLEKEDALPTQLYLSLEASNEEMYKRIDIPHLKDGWGRLNKTIKLLSKFKDKTRTVLRMTMIKDYNLKQEAIPEFAELIKIANPMFVELKAYMFVGFSQKRMVRENMPSFDEVKEFSLKLAKELNYQLVDEKKDSRVVLLMKEDTKDRIMKFD
jgi:tRNA wybutosine-synthesizing protein 1